MNCHICDFQLTLESKPHKTGFMQCRNNMCERKYIVDRCQITYDNTPIILNNNLTTNKIVAYNFWIFEDKNWYHVYKNYQNNNVTINTFKVKIIGIGKYGNIRYDLIEDPKNLVTKDIGIDIYTHDNLKEKTNKFLKRIKTIIMFS